MWFVTFNRVKILKIAKDFFLKIKLSKKLHSAHVAHLTTHKIPRISKPQLLLRQLVLPKYLEFSSKKANLKRTLVIENYAIQNFHFRKNN